VYTVSRSLTVVVNSEGVRAA
jgi:hypothetical protein